jgi:hypothetical protein
MRAETYNTFLRYLGSFELLSYHVRSLHSRGRPITGAHSSGLCTIRREFDSACQASVHVSFGCCTAGSNVSTDGLNSSISRTKYFWARYVMSRGEVI